MNESKRHKKWFVGLTIGAIIAALCCMTPLLVIGVGLLGLTAFLPYLDFVLIPLLVIFIIFAVIYYVRWRKSCPSPRKER